MITESCLTPKQGKQFLLPLSLCNTKIEGINKRDLCCYFMLYKREAEAAKLSLHFPIYGSHCMSDMSGFHNDQRLDKN